MVSGGGGGGGGGGGSCWSRPSLERAQAGLSVAEWGASTAPWEEGSGEKDPRLPRPFLPGPPAGPVRTSWWAEPTRTWEELKQDRGPPGLPFGAQSASRGTPASRLGSAGSPAGELPRRALAGAAALLGGLPPPDREP
ncbi:uncharacterized protein ACOB8E_022414 [Sarcophilus harrisii]